MYKPGDTIGLSVTQRRRGYYVYALIGDLDECFYIGMTNNPEARLLAHVLRGTPRVRERIAALKAPRMRILHGPLGDHDQALSFEKVEIEKARLVLGANLLNGPHEARYDPKRFRSKQALVSRKR